MPSPHEELCRLLGSPEPTQTMEGSEGAIAMSPIVDTASLSNTGSQVVPLFVVFHTPPDATPTNTMSGLLSTTAKSSMRPPITAGPISRNSRLFNLSVGLGWLAWPHAQVSSAPQTSNPPRAQKTVLEKEKPRLISILPQRARPGIIPPRPGEVHHLFQEGC